MSKDIMVIIPVTSEEVIEDTENEVAEIVSDETDFEVECIDYGTASIESAYDEDLAAPGVISKAIEAEEDGFNGVFIDCMGDPALGSVREKLDVPVVGPARASALYASDLAHRFSIITTLESAKVLTENLIKKYGLFEKLASIRSVDVPVLELEKTSDLQGSLNEESLRAIEEDDAHAIVLGCTGMLGVARDLSSYLEENGYDVPVIYPVEVGVKHLENLIFLGLTHSRKTYMKPHEKDRNILEVIK